jgi:hypothetical protein
MTLHPETSWQKIKRAERTFGFYVEAIMGVPCVLVGLSMLLQGDRADWWNLGVALFVLALGIGGIYDTMKRLGWIGRGG